MGVYFDGRKDRTRKIETIEMKKIQKCVVEKRVVLVEEPSGSLLYWTHYSCARFCWQYF